MSDNEGNDRFPFLPTGTHPAFVQPGGFEAPRHTRLTVSLDF